MSLPIVAIVGRPNVGKSTLFNRIVRERMAIVEDWPGVTRDRLSARAVWLDREFYLVDTGGITAGEDPLIVQVRQQAKVAMEEADVIVFIADGRFGLHPDDEEVARTLRRTKKPIILCVNKVENHKTGIDPEFYKLGYGEPIQISAEHAMNIGDLLDAVIDKFPEEEEIPEIDAIRVAVVGRPNAGKSSLVNALLGEERVIVSDIPGTTRDAIDSLLEFEDQQYLIIDTAGIRRKSKVDDPVEYYSVLRAMRAIERADVAVVVLDATDFLTEQDRRVAGLAQEANKACVLLVNKWDIAQKDEKTAQDMEEQIRTELGSLEYAPIMFMSAKTHWHLNRLLPMINAVANEYNHRVPTRVLNQLLADAVAMHHPPARKGRELKIHYMTQVQIKPPTFALWVNDPLLMHFSYQRYLENRVRESFGFNGTPVKWILKRRPADGKGSRKDKE